MVWVVQVLNGVAWGMVLFILAAGLTVLFGLMKVANLAHGSLYMIGAFVGVTVGLRTGNFVLAVIAATASAGVLGMVIELLLRRMPRDPLPQVLLTLGLTFIFTDIVLWIWGGWPQPMIKPAFAEGSINLGVIHFPIYRLLVIALGLAVAIFLGLFLQKTRVGALVRAAVDDPQMLQGLGVNVPLMWSLMFGLGACLAGFAGIIGQPFTGVCLGVDMDVLLLALVVIILGGVGSLKGALVGGLLIGVLSTFTLALVPELAMFSIFAPLAIILIFRPHGLFGK